MCTEKTNSINFVLQGNDFKYVKKTARKKIVKEVCFKRNKRKENKKNEMEEYKSSFKIIF